MALTKLPKNAIADGAIDDSKIEDGTIQNQEIQGSLTNEKFAGSIANDRLANSSITVAGSTVSLGASTTIATDTDWQALTVADGSTQVITEAGKGYFLDTNAGIIEVFLPSSPTRGDTVILADYAGTFGTNQIIINTGGENIDSTVGSEFKVTTNNAIVECVYVDAAKGWLVYLNQAAGTTPSGIVNEFGGYDTLPAGFPFISATGGTVTTDGDYKIHTFTGDGTFELDYVPCGSATYPNTVDYLVVAGGGGSGSGGGGAGGFREGKQAGSPTHTAPCHTASPLAVSTGITVSVQSYPITVGAGGAGQTKGSDSIFSTITSAGGGRGIHIYSGPGRCGGSGGGAPVDGSPNPGAAGNVPPVSPPQGNPGGNSPSFSFAAAGGGGGALGSGSPGNPAPAGSGGAGGPGGAGAGTLINPATGESGPGCLQYYAGGGGGGANTNVGPAGDSSGGIGGGGNGAGACSGNGQPGTANTGGGAGGREYEGSPASGGKGIVIIRYKFQ